MSADLTNDLRRDLEVLDDSPDSPDDGIAVGDRPVVRPRRRRARRSARRAAVLEWSIVAASPALLFLVLRPEPFFIGNGVDPFLYLGYAWDPKDLIARFGMEYYPVRFGLTLPIDLFTRVFGVVGGYWTLRYVLALVAIVPLYAYLRTRSRAMGALGVVLYLSSPMLLRGLLSSYSDTTGVAYLTSAISLLLLSQVTMSWRWAKMLTAGAMLGLAVHSNPIIAAIALAICGGWAICEVWARRWRILADAALVATGTGAVTAFGVAYFWYRFDQPDIFSPSIDATLHWSGKAGESFHSPDLSWLGVRFYLYLPPLILVCWLIGLVGRPRPARDGWALMTILAGVSMFFVVHEFVLAGSSMEAYYYTSYLTPVIVLGLVAIVERLLAGHSRWWGWGLAAAVVAFPLVRSVAFDSFDFDWNPGLVVLVAAVIGVAVVAALSHEVAPVAALAVLGANALLLFCAPPNAPFDPALAFRPYDPHYELAIENDNTTGMSWYEMSHQLVEAMPPLTGKDGNLLFWYQSDKQPFSSLQATYRHLVIGWHANMAEYPEITPPMMQRLADEHVGRLVLFGDDDATLRAGKDSLRRHGVRIVSQRRVRLHAPGYEAYVDILRIAAPTAAA